MKRALTQEDRRRALMLMSRERLAVFDQLMAMVTDAKHREGQCEMERKRAARNLSLANRAARTTGRPMDADTRQRMSRRVREWKDRRTGARRDGKSALKRAEAMLREELRNEKARRTTEALSTQKESE